MKLPKFQTHYNIQGYFKINNEFKNIENFDPLDLISGQIGDDGLRGIEGDIGQIGVKGQRGFTGPKGDKGPLGPRGDIGPRGPKGPIGVPGVKGKQGLRGEQGEKGNSGLKGSIGDRGPMGELGYTGPMGLRGDMGNIGEEGEKGDDGYKGFFSFLYGNKCEQTDWSGWGKDYEIKCPQGTAATKIETRCSCGDSKWKAMSEGDRTSCGWTSKNQVDRDCEHRLTCCPYGIWDIPEKENIVKKRLFYGKAGLDEERLINKIWISLKPNGLDKTIKDYPEGFFSTENVGGVIKIIDTSINQKPIPYAQECSSQFCSKEGQLCVDNKVCLNKINPNNECLKPPCWHNRVPPTDSCDSTFCENIGQYCTKGKICTMDTNDNCKTPPCWNIMPDLKDCPGKRCPTPGQQCSLGGEKYNFPGFTCKDEVNENPNNNKSEWCRNPPCWHKIPNFTDTCPDGKCQFIGQKCGPDPECPIIDGVIDPSCEKNRLYNKICLNEPNGSCTNPPCWHAVKDPGICSDILTNSIFCEYTSLKDNDGNVVNNSDGKEIRIIQGDCKYEGNCSNIGQQCKIDNEVKYECMNVKRKDKTSQNKLNIDRSRCNKLPCWIPNSNENSDADVEKNLYEQINQNNYKNNSIIDSLKKIEKSQTFNDYYEFTEEDRKGELTSMQLWSFFRDNFVVFEQNANYYNFLEIWKLFTGKNDGAGAINYYQFADLIRKLNAEKFKYRDGGGRIYPKIMNDDEYNSLFTPFVSTA